MKRYFNVAGMGGMQTTVPVKIIATAKMDVTTSMSTTVPDSLQPRFEAGDYNRIYAYCYDDKKKNEANRAAAR